MRTRSQIEGEALYLSSKSLMTRSENILLEVLLDVRDGLFEDRETPTKGIEA